MENKPPCSNINTRSVAGKVEYCLQKKPKTRNSDASLICNIYYLFFNDRMIEKDGRFYASLNALADGTLPKPESIRRSRQKFNEVGCGKCGHKYPADDPVVLARRVKEMTVHSSISTEEWESAIHTIEN